MKIITNRPIIVGTEQKSYFPDNPFQKSPYNSFPSIQSGGLTNPWSNAGTQSGGLTNPWARTQTNYLQKSIDQKKLEDFKNSPEYAEMKKRIEEQEKSNDKIFNVLTDEKKSNELLTNDEKKITKKWGTGMIVAAGVVTIGGVLLLVGLVKLIKK